MIAYFGNLFSMLVSVCLLVGTLRFVRRAA